MKAKQIAAVLLTGCLILSGCAQGASDTSTKSSTEITEVEEESANETATSSSSYTTSGIATDLVGSYSEKQIAAEWSEDDATVITCDGTTVEIDGDGASESGGVITITAEGCYVLSGELSEGAIVVTVTEEENVQLVLNGFTITNSTTAPIYAESAKNLYITLAEGTENSVVDQRDASTVADAEESTDTTAAESTDEGAEAAEDESAEETDLSAAIYATCDLIINGDGELSVSGSYNDGITSKDDLKIISGTISVDAVDDGIVGHDSISIRDGVISVSATDDGLKVSERDDTEKGYLIIDGGTISIDVDDKGIDVTNVVVINGGAVTIDAGDEGIESLNIVQNAGDVEITAGDDGINISDNSGTGTEMEGMMGGGPMGDASGEMPSGEAPSGEMPSGEMPSGGPGGMPGMENTESSDTDASASDSSSADTYSESSDTPQAAGMMGGPGGGRGGMGGGPMGDASGEMPSGEAPSGEAPDAGSSDDTEGFGGQGGQGGMGGQMGGMAGETNIDGAFVMNGGTLTIEAYGDGIDSNGDIEITGGVIVVSGPENGANGSLDYSGSCVISDAVLFVAGANGMQQTESSESTQRMAVATLSQSQEAGTVVSVVDESGNELYTFTVETAYNYIAISSPETTSTDAQISFAIDGETYDTTIQ